MKKLSVLKNLFKKPSWLLIFLPLLVLIQPYLQTGVPYTHDGENHLARFANYKVAIREGQFPPRLAPNLMNHYGYPVFNYNYPLANILSLPLSVLGVSYELIFKLLMVAGLSLGAVGIISWLKLLNFSLLSTLFVAGTYFTAPFVANLIYVRGNIGEVWALGLFPWLLWLTQRWKQKKFVSWKISIPIVLGFLLSHNISVMFGMILWFFYNLCILKFDRTNWLQWLKTVLLAGLLSLWFWLPAVAEKNLVVLDETNLNVGSIEHLVQPSQLVTSPLTFGFSFSVPIDTLSLAVGLLPLFSLLIASLWLIKYGRTNRQLAHKLFFLCLAGGFLLILQTPASQVFWKTIPLIGFIQFPWRLTLFWLIFTAPLVAFTWQLGRGFKWLLGLLFLIQILAVFRLSAIAIFHKSTLEYDLFPQSTSSLNENLPKTFTYILFGDWSPEPRVLNGQAEFTVEHWTGSSRRYQLLVTQEALIAEPTMNFAGWQTTANDKPVTYLNDDLIQGRLAYQLVPGEYQIVSRFTQQTWPRITGNVISGLALLVWAGLIWQEKKQTLKKS